MFFVNGSVRFSYEWKILIFTVMLPTESQLNYLCTYMCFAHWDTNVLSDRNKYPTFSM